MVEQDVDGIVAKEDRTFGRIMRGPAHKEAVQAFLEKREPRFNQV
jgi:enoyl-CoA hydratase/carnithine racemase